MKFDKRNPFAAWGHEQEIYTMSGENETVEISTESKGFQNMADLTNNELFVTNPDSDVKVVSQEDYTDTHDAFANFRTNNEDGLPADMFKKRAVAGQDNEYKQSEDYNNTEVNYYGIHADDLKLYGEASEEEEGGDGNNNTNSTQPKDDTNETPTVGTDTTTQP